jgi:putative tryptophan/tyrosine transport system substrate-binding protein
MRRREFVAGLALATVSGTALALPARTRPLIGALAAGRRNAFSPLLSAFLEGMRDAGYVEGEGFDFAFRFADGDLTKLTADAEELVSLKPDVIVPIDPVATGAVKKATSTIPIVAPILVDPVNQGLIASYSRPGGNLTGVANIVPGLWGKVVEIAHELVPTAATIGLLFNPANPTHVHVRPEIESAGVASGVKIVAAGAAATTELDPAFKALVAAGVQAVLVIADPLFLGETVRISALALGVHLPTLSNAREFVEAGGLISYGISLAANEHQSASFVERILRGAKPADLPVEFPTKIEMVVNLKTARALGLTVPPTLLASADEVIE